jgi:hypothetical protein
MNKFDQELYGYSAEAPPDQPSPQIQKLIGVGALLLSAVGLILTQSSVSVATGAGIIYVGLALGVGGAIVAWVMGGSATWLKIVTALILVACLASTIYDVHALSVRQQQIETCLHDLTSASCSNLP